MSSLRPRWCALLFCAALVAGCGGSDRVVIVTVSQIPSSAVELQARVVIANHTSEPQYFPLTSSPASLDKRSLGLRLSVDRVGYLNVEIIARDVHMCEVAGVVLLSSLNKNSEAEINFERTLGPVGEPVCGTPRHPGMGVVPPGDYLLGCNPGEPSCESPEGPARTVHFDAFELDGTEVPVGAYRDCVTASVCSPAQHVGTDRDDLDARNGVDWNQATTYCNWIGKRLPTEGEWEAGARGGDQRVFPWGDEFPDCDRANFSNGGATCLPTGNGKFFNVAARSAGRARIGFYNMAGNVNEWVSDFSAPRANLTDEESAHGGPPNGSFRMFKGGGFLDDPPTLRVAHRAALLPDGSAPDTGQGPVTPELSLPQLGFRCALTR